MDEPLFPEPMTVHPSGPIVPVVYEQYKDIGDEPILQSRSGDPAILNTDEEEILEQVWDEFGCYTASRLRQMAKKEPPWADAAERTGTPLSLKKIKRFFEETYVVNQTWEKR